MKNVIATIPKSRFPDWPSAQEIVEKCDGETIWPKRKHPMFWTIRMPRPPKESLIGSLCYMVYDGQIRGYFDVVDFDLASNWQWHKKKHQTGHVLVLANWHPVADGVEMKGFQGWRYTALRPF